MLLKISKISTIGFVAGFVGTFLGLGGGIVFVPALVFFLSFSQHEAHGSSLAVILPTALVGASTYAVNGFMDIGVVLWVAIGSMAGAFIGSYFAVKILPQHLRLIYGVLLFVVAIRMIFV